MENGLEAMDRGVVEDWARRCSKYRPRMIAAITRPPGITQATQKKANSCQSCFATSVPTEESDYRVIDPPD